MTEPSNSSEESRKIEGKTLHSKQRAQEAQEGDVTRQVIDVNRVVRVDTETGYDVYTYLVASYVQSDQYLEKNR